jgi:hypothetical protein
MEKLLRVSVKEMVRFRVVCTECKSSVELTLDRLRLAPLRCSCGKELRNPGVDTAVKELCRHLEYLQQQPDFDLQVVLAED